MLISASDYTEDVLALICRESTAVRVENGFVKIDLGDIDPYEISLAQIQSERQILEWVSHLCRRKGMDSVAVDAFIKITLEHLDRNPPSRQG